MTPDNPTDHTRAAGNEEADGYTRFGPGPLAAIRIKWTVRAIGNITYVVDEAVGQSDSVITSAPMSAEAAIHYVDERERAARERFEQLRSDMAWPTPDAAERISR